ncbi:MAG: hypothetical protein IH995_00930 [Proteobacteria bacterium]|nr:hypothetical protein [Pseudomonadota bacterium]
MINKNVISGLLLFSISILIGPYLMGPFAKETLGPARMKVFTEASELDNALEAHKELTDPEALAVSTEAIAVAAGKTVIEDFKASRVNDRWGHFVFSHAHGNLQGMLNILVGLVLAQLAIAVRFREIISWLFIAGSWGHAGFFIAGNFLITEHRELGFFFLSNAKYGGGLLILGLGLLLVATIMHTRGAQIAKA